jgi:amino acid transporter
MSTVSEILKISAYVLLGLWFLSVLWIILIAAGVLFGFLSFEGATAKAKVVRKNLLRIWLAILGLMLLAGILSVILGQK